MANHGAVAFAGDVEDAVELALLLEWACDGLLARAGRRRAAGARRGRSAGGDRGGARARLRRHAAAPRRTDERRDARDRDGRARARRARAAGRGDPRGPGRRARRGDPDHRRGLGRRHRADAGQARRRACAAPARSAPTRSATCCSSCSSAAGSTPSCCVRRDDVQTSASVLPIRPDGSRPAFHVIGANATYGADDAPLGRIAAATHLHLGGPEFMGGEAAAEILAHAARRGIARRPTCSRPATRACSSGSARLAAPRLLPAQRRAGARLHRRGRPRGRLPRAGRARAAAWRRPAAPRARWWSTPTARDRVPAFDGRGRRHDRLRRRVLGRLPARARPGARAARGGAARLRRRGARGPRPGLRPRRLRPRRRRRVRRRRERRRRRISSDSSFEREIGYSRGVLEATASFDSPIGELLAAGDVEVADRSLHAGRPPPGPRTAPTGSETRSRSPAPGPAPRVLHGRAARGRRAARPTWSGSATASGRRARI